MSRFWLSFLFFSLLVLQLQAQQSDAELWKGIKLDWEIIDQLGVSVENHVRLKNNFSTFKSDVTEVSFESKLLKLVRLSSGYRFTLEPSANKHRVFYDISVRPEISSLNTQFNFRLRNQHEFQNAEQVEGTLRPRITIKYSKKKLKIEPLVGIEAFYQYDFKENEWNRYRLMFGFDYDLPRKATLDVLYIFQKEFNEPGAEQSHIFRITLALDMSFKKKKDKAEEENQN